MQQVFDQVQQKQQCQAQQKNNQDEQSYNYKKRQILKQYLFFSNNNQQLYNQIKQTNKQIKIKQSKIKSVKQILQKQLPKIIRKQYQDHLDELQYQRNQLNQYKNQLNQNIKQTIQKQLNIKNRCDQLWQIKKLKQSQSILQNDTPAFNYYYQKNIHCQYSQYSIAQFLCNNPLCKKLPFICQFQSCKCKIDHQSCSFIVSQRFIEDIIQKIEKGFKQRQDVQYIESKSVLYELMLNLVSQERSCIQQWYQDLLKAIKSQLNGSSQKIENHEQKNLVLYGINKQGQVSNCVQKKVYYQKFSANIHQDCDCMPLIIQTWKIPKNQLEQTYKQICKDYEKLIQKLQQKVELYEKQMMNINLNIHQSQFIHYITKNQFVLNNSYRMINGSTIYYSNRYKNYQFDQRYLKSLNKQFIKDQWKNKIQIIFMKHILGNLIQRVQILPVKQIKTVNSIDRLLKLIDVIDENLKILPISQTKTSLRQRKLIQKIQKIYHLQNLQQRKFFFKQKHGKFYQCISVSESFMNTKTLIPINQLNLKFNLSLDVFITLRKNTVKQISLQIAPSQIDIVKVRQNFRTLNTFHFSHNLKQNLNVINQYQFFDSKTLLDTLNKSFNFDDFIYKIEQIFNLFRNLPLYSDQQHRFDQFYQKLVLQNKNRKKAIQLFLKDSKKINRMRDFMESSLLNNSCIKNGLKSLILLEVNIANSFIKLIQANPKLQSIIIYNCSSINKNNVQTIFKKCLNLRQLLIKYNQNYANSATFNQSKVENYPLQSCSNLNSLTLNNFKYQLSPLRDYLNIIQKKIINTQFYNCQLIYLNIANIFITNQQFLKFKIFTSLQTLVCGRLNNILGNSLIQIAKYCCKIRKLSLEGMGNCSIKSEHIQKIGELLFLTHLNIAHISSIKLGSWLVKLKNLKFIKLTPSAFLQQFSILQKRGVTVLK